MPGCRPCCISRSRMPASFRSTRAAAGSRQNFSATGGLLCRWACRAFQTSPKPPTPSGSSSTQSTPGRGRSPAGSAAGWAAGTAAGPPANARAGRRERWSRWGRTAGAASGGSCPAPGQVGGELLLCVGGQRGGRGARPAELPAAPRRRAPGPAPAISARRAVLLAVLAIVLPGVGGDLEEHVAAGDEAAEELDAVLGDGLRKAAAAGGTAWHDSGKGGALPVYSLNGTLDFTAVGKN